MKIQSSSVGEEGAVVKRDEVGGGGDVWTHPEENRQTTPRMKVFCINMV